MQLFVYISSNPEVVSPLMSELLSKGIHGATSVDCKGMLKSINDSSVEPPPVFGSLRKFINPVVKAAVHKICGDLRLPNTGIFFSVPVMNWEGVSHR